MERQIKFRAWDKKNHTMVKVWEITWTGFDGEQVDSFFAVNPVVKGEYIIKQKAAILMQYTGLKDKNGVDIYEDDIVEITTTGITWGQEYLYIGRVIFSRAAFAVAAINNNKNHIIGFNPNRPVKVIGNIYQNPELLK